jgi:hypothetical protein
METLNIKTSLNYILAKTGLAFCLVVIIGIILCNCTNNSTGPSLDTAKPIDGQTPNQALITDTISDQYISVKDPLYACHFINGGKDSLKIGTKKYAISTRSRYRSFPGPANFGNTVSERAVKIYDPIIFLHDTKTDSNYVFNSCQF